MAWRQRWSLPYQTLVPGAIAVGLVGLLRGLGLLTGAEWATLDSFWRGRWPENLEARVVVVRITEEDLRRYGYPLPDGVLATALTKLQAQNPRGIGVDIFRDLPVGTGGDRLAVLWQDERIVAIEKSVLPDPENSRVKPPPGVLPHQVGFADVLPDRDGRVRRALLSAPGLDGDYRFSLAMRLVERYLYAEGVTLTNGLRDPQAFRFGTVEVPRFRGDWGGYVREDDGGNQILVPWPRLPVQSGDMRFPSMTLHQLLSGAGPPVTDRLVLLGYAAAASAKDTLQVPAVSTTEIYGVEYHALVIAHLLGMALDGRPPLRAFPGWLSYLWL
ncbi:MAG: CHASE2 domain-containing protein, partial [Pseudanabaenaceae cyanobacterium]